MQICLSCNKEFDGRSNQKFCSTSCKNSYHNLKNKEKEAIVIDINKKLHKNWVVLQKLYGIYRSSPISMEIVEAHGFKPKYFTHIHQAPNGEKYTMLYDHGYKNHIDNQIQIIQSED